MQRGAARPSCSSMCSVDVRRAHIRILCEYEETMQRLRAQSVRATVMFFGSARSKDSEAHAKAMEKAKTRIAAAEAAAPRRRPTPRRR